ncbi:MAG TPA: hypothetical protein VLD13_01485 [Gaiellaceae bacterium]|nr:hypothetical protein [Gaiellaceae bacterium]
MSSVAYPAQPAGPGWWRTAWLMFLGWLTAAIALGGLYVVGFAVGTIGTSTNVSEAGVINDWPFPDNGWWSLVANLATYVLALGITTVAVAAQLRGRFSTVSEERLALVLLLTGGIPFLLPEHGGGIVFGFVIAVWAVRAWVVRDEFRFARRTLALLGGILLLTIASYGFLHPVWVADAQLTTAPKSTRNVLLLLHNAGRVGVEVDHVSGAPFPSVRPGFPWKPERAAAVRFPPSSTRAFTLTMRGSGCGPFDVRVRYRILGITLSEPLRVAPFGLAGC